MKQSSNQYTTLFPLFAGSCIIILSILVFASYQKTANMQSTVILPGGVTYLGK